jgi:hypothetical protein
MSAAAEMLGQPGRFRGSVGMRSFPTNYFASAAWAAASRAMGTRNGLQLT